MSKGEGYFFGEWKGNVSEREKDASRSGKAFSSFSNISGETNFSQFIFGPLRKQGKKKDYQV